MHVKTKFEAEKSFRVGFRSVNTRRLRSSVSRICQILKILNDLRVSSLKAYLGPGHHFSWNFPYII